MGGLYGTGTLIRLSLSNIYEYKQNNRTQNPLVWRPKALTKETRYERTKNKIICRLTKCNRKRKQNKRTQNTLVWRTKMLTKQTTNERRIRLSTD